MQELQPPQAETTPKQASATTPRMDLSSICNYADESATPRDLHPSTVEASPATMFSGEQFLGPGDESVCDQTFAFVDEAIPFITITEDSKRFEVHPQAVKLLESIESDVGVVTIAGPYRSGKSSLAGRALLGNPRAFQAGHSVNPCTKGLWIYGRPISDCKTADGKQMVAVVIDTEGLNALDECQNHDLRVLTLAVLLSSKLVYNSMHAIDEQTLSQLNVVVNLTKHIQVKTSQANRDFQDPEELAKIFPSFLWLVRDFNLALVDQNGAPITSREYLELALEEQAGMSERTEIKNRTRRLFKSLFVERDCLTLDRPVSDEKQLHALSEIPTEDLKPNFVRQIETLRKRVLSKMRAKTLNGHSITGRVLAHLARQYVASFNEGQVPNVESAWTYICINESQKALSLARQRFEQLLQARLQLPSTLDDLHAVFKEAKQTAVKVYRERSMDDRLSVENSKRVGAECKQVYEQVKASNEEACAQVCTLYLNQCHAELMQSLATTTSLEAEESLGIKNLDEAEAALCQLEHTFSHQGPQVEQTTKSLIFEKFRAQVAFECGTHFIRMHQKEGSVRTAVLEQKCADLENEVAETVKDSKTQLDRVSEQLKVKERDLCEARIAQTLAEDAQQRQEKDQVRAETEMRAAWDADKRRLNNEVSQARAAKELAESQLQTVQRQALEASSQVEKEAALHLQEIEHLRKVESELKQREADLNEQLKLQSQEQLNERKAREDQLQSELNQAVQKAAEESEKASDLVEQMQQLETKLSEERAHFEEAEKLLKELVSKLEGELSTKTQCDSESGLKLETQLKEAQEKLQEVKSDLESQTETAKTELKTLVQEKDNEIARHLKTIAILTQKESQVSERATQLKKQLTEAKSEAESLQAHLASESSGGATVSQSEHSAALDSLQKSHQEETDALLAFHKHEMTTLGEEVATTHQKLEQHSLSAKIETADLQKQVTVLQEQVNELEAQKETLEGKCEVQKRRNDTVLEQIQSKSSESWVTLTQQHEAQVLELEQTIEQLQEDTKLELAKLKMAFEKEKEQLNSQWQVDKDSLREAENELRASYESRIAADEQKTDEERHFLQSQLAQLNFASQTQIEKAQRDLVLLSNEHNNLKAIHAEKLSQLRQLEQQSETKLQHQQESHREEIKQVQARLEAQTLTLTSKEQALVTTSLSLEQAASEARRRKEQLDVIEETHKAEAARLEGRLNELREENSTLKDQLQGKNLDFSRESALREQKLDFLERKLTEQQVAADQRCREFEDRLAFARTEKAQALAEQAQTHSELKAELTKKLESRREALKAVQAELSQKVPELQRKNLVLQTELDQLRSVAESDKHKIQMHAEREVEQLREALENAQQEFQLLETRASQSKARAQELEKLNQSLVNESEKDKALFEDKVQFLGEQRARVESERADCERKLKDEQENLQRIRNSEKEKATRNRQECVTHLENYYKQLTQRHQEESKKTIEESAKRLATLQSQNQEMSLQLEVAKRERDLALRTNTERQDKHERLETRLRYELEQVQKTLQEATQSHEAAIDQCRETARSKVIKAEKDRKEMELAQTAQRHNFSIEEAKWNLKSEQQLNEVRQLQEELERRQRKLETLLRENQKLRTSHRSQFQVSSLGGYSSNRSSSGGAFMATLKANQLSQVTQDAQREDPQALENQRTSTAGAKKEASSGHASVQQSQLSRHLRSQVTPSNPSGMTKVATFSTKSTRLGTGTGLLSRQIQEAMARCSPTSKAESQVQFNGGASTLLVSRNLSKTHLKLGATQTPKIQANMPFQRPLQRSTLADLSQNQAHQQRQSLVSDSKSPSSERRISEKPLAKVSLRPSVDQSDEENYEPGFPMPQKKSVTRYNEVGGDEDELISQKFGKTTEMTLEELICDNGPAADEPGHF